MGNKRFFASIDNVKNGQVILDGTEHNHLKNVMRITVGEEVIIVCGDQFDYLCKVEEIGRNRTVLGIMQKTKNEFNPEVKLTVFQSLVKRPAMELTIQKLTELGVLTFIPFESRYSVIQTKQGKESKLQEISNQSIKQCRRSIPMQVEPAISFKNMVKKLSDYDIVLFANEAEEKGLGLKEILSKNSKSSKIAVIIGPEGGFSPEEITALSKVASSISLGKRILRAETASIALASIIMFMEGEIWWKHVLISLGCKTNKYEVDCLANMFKEAGYEVFTHLQPADIYVVNTCAVTQEAEKKSRQYIAKINKENPNAKIFICGCASQNNPEQFKGKDNVVSVIGNAGKENVFNLIKDEVSKIFELPTKYDCIAHPLKTKTRAYLKIQDGCNNFCSYCIIPYLRGRSRSRKLSSIVAEAKAMAKDTKEIVITGIDISSYKVSDGERDKYLAKYYAKPGRTSDLAVLLDALSGIHARIRLSSFYEDIINDNLLQCLKRMPNFAPQFHLSLQSGSDRILKLMNRKYNRRQYLEKVNLIRKYFPDANITTDIIVGFPTETDRDFANSVNIIKKEKFGDLHILTNSHRTGTVASQMEDLPSEIKKQRLHELEEVGAQMRQKYLNKCLGKDYELLVEDEENGFWTGYTENYIKAYVTKSEKIKNGELVKIKAEQLFRNGVLAKIR